MSKTSVKVLALITCLCALPLMVGLTGCAGDRYNQSTGHSLDDQRTAERGYGQSADPIVEDRRTAERVREALAAAPEYKFDGVKVMAGNGVVQLSGFVNTSAQRNTAEEVAGKVVGVKSVENNLTVKD
jgi:hyperosmotically inducible protein